MSSTDGDEFVRPLIDLMKFGGFWFDFKHRKFGFVFTWLNVLRHLMALAVSLFQTFQLTSLGASYLLSESAVFIPISFNEMSVAYAIIFNIGSVTEIIEKYKVKFGALARQRWARNIICSEFDKFNKIFLVPKFALIIFYIFYVVVPIGFDTIRAVLGKEPYVVPLPLNFLLEEPIVRSSVYFVDLVLSYLFFLIIVPRYIAFQGILLYFVIFIVVDIKILVYKLRRLSNDDDGSVFLQKAWDLRDVVEHHAEIVHMVSCKYSFIGFAVMMENGFTSLASCLVLFLLKTSLANHDYVLAAFCSVFQLWVLLIIVMFNGSGTVIHNESLELSNVIYNIPWYKQPPKVRKKFLPMVQQSVKLLNISYKGQIIDLNSSMKVMNQAYSFFTLINSRT